MGKRSILDNFVCRELKTFLLSLHIKKISYLYLLWVHGVINGMEKKETNSEIEGVTNTRPSSHIQYTD